MLLVTLVSRQSENMPTIEMALSLDLNLENGTIEHQLTGIKSNKNLLWKLDSCLVKRLFP